MGRSPSTGVAAALLACLALSSWAVQPDPGAVPDPAPSPHPSADPAKDGASRIRSQNYQKTFVKAVPFFEAAEQSGVKVQPEEVAARLAAYAEIYPGQPFDASGVERLLKAEKYLAAQGVAANDRDVESRMAELTASGAPIGDGNREPIRQILKAEILFGGKDVQRMGEQAMEMTALQNQDRGEEAWALWPLESLRLQGSPEECLASAKDGCWVTVEEYNAVLGEVRVPRAVPLDTAKATALRKYLVEKQLAKDEPFPGNRTADSLIAEMKLLNAAQRTLFRTRGMGRQVSDPEVLGATYGKYYRDLFKARTVATLGLIASSDSGYIDSLHRVMESWRQQDSALRKAGRKPPEMPALPWVSFSEDALPGIIASRTDTLQSGEFSRPIATPFGHFLVRVQEVHRIKEVSYREAYPRLVFLATRDKFLGMDSVVAAKSLRYYKKNPDDFKIPDTLALTAWLVPFRLEKRGRETRLSLSPHPEKDTLAFSPIRISSLQLPWDMQRRLSALNRDFTPVGRKRLAKPFLGPLKGEFGQWLFRVEGARKGSGLLAYETVKRDIVGKLASWDVEPDTLARDSVKQNVLITLGLARLHGQKTFEKWRTMPAETVERMIQTGEIDTAGVSRGPVGDQYVELIKQRMARKDDETDSRTAHAFLNEVEIDYAKLFGR